MSGIKKLTKIFLLLTIGFLVSCSNDDSSNSNSNNEKILGTWELISFKVNDFEFIDNNDCYDTLTFTETTLVSNEYWDYDDGNGCVLDYTSDPGTYSINGNTLIGTIEGETVTFLILELNATTLKLEATITEEGETFTFIQTFRKV